MNLSALKNKFFAYLASEGKLDETNSNYGSEGINASTATADYSNFSIFKYASEFKSFLESEYNTVGVQLAGKSISDILEMEIEYGKIVEELEDESVETAEEAEVTDPNTGECENTEETAIVTDVEEQITEELCDDMSTSEAETIVDDFEGEITDGVETELINGEVNAFDIFKEIYSDLAENSEFIQAIDVDNSKEIDKNEFGNFLNSIKGLDNNEEDVSIMDLLTSASQIKEGTFKFISTPSNTDTSDVPSTNDVADSTVSDSVPTMDHITVETPEGVDSSLTTGGEDLNIDVPVGDCGDLGATLGAATGDCGNLDAMTGELEALQAEKAETETDLGEQTEQYNSTQEEKEQVVGELCGQIEEGESDLGCAQEEVDTAAQEKETAQCEVETAQAETEQAKTEADDAQCGLQDAQCQTQEAQENSDTAAENNQQAIQEEQQAQTESEQANEDLAGATTATGEAQTVADGRGEDLAVAQVEAAEAFSVLNLKNDEVAQAQSEYDNAKAQQSNAEPNIFERIANWVSGLFNKLMDAINQRDHAQAEADRKAAEEERAQVASDEALEELEQRKEEQAEAQAVADAAQVVYDAKTGAREVSDQEYAEALVVLAQSMEAEENAEAEYNTAFDNYIQMNNYKVDAEGRLMDAEGNYISAAQVAQELEVYIQGLVEARDTEEKSYDDVLVATAAVIAGDEAKIQELGTEIAELQAEIEEEEKRIALQESMITEMSTRQSELNAAQASGGFVDDIVSFFGGGTAKEQQEIYEDEAMLEEALLSGDPEKIEAAYRAIYGDKEIVLDANGNVVTDPLSLSDEERAQCTYTTVGELSDENLSLVMNNEAASIVESAEIVEIIDSGAIVCDGEEVDREEINSIIDDQIAELEQDLEDAISQQGIISKGVGFLNNGLGVGTSEAEARAQLEMYKQLAEQLKHCTDPVEYAALFKQITGRDFSADAVIELKAYDKLSSGETTESTDDSVATSEVEEGKLDISSYVNEVVDTVNEDENLDRDSLSMTRDNRATEAMEDYKETQETVKDAAVGVVSGVVSTVVVTACTAAGICAAPFTAGASLGMIAAGFGIAASTGAAVSTGLNAIDSVYDADGDGSADWNYTWSDAGKDALSGALNGIVGNLANGAGAAVANKIGSQATQTALTTGLKNTTAKYAGAAIEGFIDGSVGSGGEYAITAMFDENVDFSFQQLGEVALQGGVFGSVFNVGLTYATTGLSALGDGYNARGLDLDGHNAGLLEDPNAGQLRLEAPDDFDPNFKADADIDPDDVNFRSGTDADADIDPDDVNFRSGTDAEADVNPDDADFRTGTDSDADEVADNTNSNVEPDVDPEVQKRFEEHYNQIQKDIQDFINNPPSDPAELKKAYRALMKRCHADVVPKEFSETQKGLLEELAKDLNNAYDNLK